MATPLWLSFDWEVIILDRIFRCRSRSPDVIWGCLVLGEADIWGWYPVQPGDAVSRDGNCGGSWSDLDKVKAHVERKVAEMVPYVSATAMAPTPEPDGRLAHCPTCRCFA